MAKAVALLSGGLDSLLAIRLIQEQGIDVEAVHMEHGFGKTLPPGVPGDAQKAAAQLGVPLRVINDAERLLQIVKHPEHGFGSQMNPCIDCRILALRQASGFLHDRGADFLVTGEVVGQRPMSQRHFTIQMIEREAGVAGRVVRPLCAKLLPPSRAEQEGLVDRSKLLAICGRSRKPQIALAEQFGLRDYPSPAGGCLLTDPGFSRRLRDLLEHDPTASRNDVELLKLGRHFRLDHRTKAVVGRNERENPEIEALARPEDRLAELVGLPGPLTLLRGDTPDAHVHLAAALTVRFSKARGGADVPVTVRWPGGGRVDTVVASAPEERTMERLGV